MGLVCRCSLAPVRYVNPAGFYPDATGMRPGAQPLPIFRERSLNRRCATVHGSCWREPHRQSKIPVLPLPPACKGRPWCDGSKLGSENLRKPKYHSEIYLAAPALAASWRVKVVFRRFVRLVTSASRQLKLRRWLDDCRLLWRLGLQALAEGLRRPLLLRLFEYLRAGKPRD